MFERTDPNTLIKWLVFAAVVYLVVPFDLVPDFLGFPGRIDDVLIMAWLGWFYWNHLRQYRSSESEREDPGQSAGTGQGSPASSSAKTFDPYRVLGITRTASRDAIQAAYRSRMQEYHPDKVAHLGQELQTLAHEKSQQIQRAYRELHR
jgi:uncharacterized membrane protein YkvA (DUF1232 family)